MLQGDARALPFATGSVQLCVTSPPYWGLRSYLPDGHADKHRECGLEATPDAYVAGMVAVFRQVWRVLRDDGVLFLNLGDSYAANRTYQVASTKGGAKHSPAQGALGASVVPDGLKPKDLVGIPWRVAFALQADGWYLRSDIIWSKPNPMPESVTDRPTKSHEYVFLLTKAERYFWNAEAVKEPALRPGRGPGNLTVYDSGRPDGLTLRANRGVTGESRNVRSVWSIATQPYAGAHFATMPERLVERCVLAGSKPGDVVLDPFLGSGTVARVATSLGRRGYGCELNREYLRLAKQRTHVTRGLPLGA